MTLSDEEFRRDKQLGRGREFTCDDASCATGACSDCPAGKFDHDSMEAMQNMNMVGGVSTYWDGVNDYNAVKDAN